MGNTLNRRSFLKRTSAALTAFTAAAGRLADAEARKDYVDIHTHLGMEWGNRPALTVDELLRWMDRHEVAQACVLPLINPESWDHPIPTGYVLEQTAPHRDRLIPFCSIDPRTLNLNSQQKRDLFRRYRDAGAKGFGEHKPGVPIDDARNLELFHAAAEAGLPTRFHLDNNRNMDKPGLPGLENVLRQVPDGVFIGHAQGWWASISGDVTQADMQRYPDTKVAPGGALDRLMNAYPNIHGDLSAGSGANAVMRDIDFGREFVIRRADRLLFGTDFLAPGQNVPQFKLYDEMDLPGDVRNKVFRGNARRILGLM